MSRARTLFHFKNLLQRQTGPPFSNLIKCHDYSTISTSSNHFRHVNNAHLSKGVSRTLYRHRYSFIYSKKVLSVINSKLSTKGNGENSAQDFDNVDTPLTKTQATELVLRLTEEERKFLLTALNEFESNQVKAEYEGECPMT